MVFRWYEGVWQILRRDVRTFTKKKISDWQWFAYKKETRSVRKTIHYYDTGNAFSLNLLHIFFQHSYHIISITDGIIQWKGIQKLVTRYDKLLINDGNGAEK